jgi:hypothetical protein
MMWRHRHWGRTVHHGGRRPGVGLGPRPLVPSAFPPCYSSPCCFLQTHATSRTGTARESSSGRSMRGERQSRGVWWPGPGVAQTRPAAVHVAHCLPTSHHCAFVPAATSRVVAVSKKQTPPQGLNSWGESGIMRGVY